MGSDFILKMNYHHHTFFCFTNHVCEVEQEFAYIQGFNGCHRVVGGQAATCLVVHGKPCKTFYTCTYSGL